MSLEDVPEAEPFLWHKVNGIAMTRAVVTGEPILTQCGKKMSRFTHTGSSSKKTLRSGAEMKNCTVCDAIQAHHAALDEEWRQEIEDARTLF